MSGPDLRAAPSSAVALLQEMLRLSVRVHELADRGHWADAADCLSERSAAFDRLRAGIESGTYDLSPEGLDVIRSIQTTDASAISAISAGRDGIRREMESLELVIRTRDTYAGLQPRDRARFTDRRG